MFSNIHITASLQQPTGESSSTGSQGTVLSLSDNADVLTRLARLEQEVFKSNVAIENKPKPERVLSDVSWSRVFEEFAKRVDYCGNSSSMSECVNSMKQFRQDLLDLSKQLDSSEMLESDFEIIEPFLKIPSIRSVSGVVEPAPGLLQRSAPGLSQQPSPVVVAETPYVDTTSSQYVATTSSSADRTSTTTYTYTPNRSFSRSSVGSVGGKGKRWGPCFYCSLQEWVPGHSCEGSRNAQLRKKEKEINQLQPAAAKRADPSWNQPSWKSSGKW